MTKRSAEISELENELRDMTGANGGLIETRWVSRLVELMREAVSTEAMECLLKVLLNTPQNDKATLSRFIQLGGIELLGQWINSYRVKPDLEHTLILNSCLSCLNKLSISTEILDKTQIGKTVNKLVKHPDSSIQAKANTIVSKWKKIVTEQDDTKRPQKLKNETRVVLPKKYSLCRPKVFEVVDNSEQVEEVSIQKTSHNILHNKIIESITTKKHIRYLILNMN
jgi:TFIIS helical bundle-like domain